VPFFEDSLAGPISWRKILAVSLDSVLRVLKLEEKPETMISGDLRESTAEEGAGPPLALPLQERKKPCPQRTVLVGDRYLSGLTRSSDWPSG
jgi:hypothetical protein